MTLYRLPGNHFYLLPRLNRHAERIFRREIDDLLLYYNDNELRQRYRFGRRTIIFITRLLQNEISPATNRNHAVSCDNTETSIDNTEISGLVFNKSPETQWLV